VSAFERQSVISGIGQSAVGRRLNRTGVDLTIEAAREAVADAGLTFAEIDGLATYPGAAGAGGADFAGPGVTEMQDALRLELNWYSGSAEGPAQIQAVINAVLAVGAGLARHVLVYRTVTEAARHPLLYPAPTGRSAERRAAGRRRSAGGAGASGMVQWTLPFRAYSAANWLALYAQRHFHEFGTTREQLAQIALNARRNAEHNPKAILREPMSMDDYFAARMITTPFCLFDCDIPADGSTAVVVSVAEHARAVDHAAPVVEAVGTAFTGRPSWDQRADLTTMGALDAAQSMWARTDLTAADVASPELTTASVPDHVVAGGARLAATAGDPFVEGGPDRATGASAEHQRRASGAAAGSTASGSCTRRAHSCAATRATVRCEDRSTSPSSAMGEDRSQAACS
jgi:acetyl-CoA acetyltransferase